MSRPAVVVLGPSALATARQVAAAVEGELHGFAPRVDGCAQSFTVAGEHLRHLFMARQPIVGVCAAGILIRALASVLDDKHHEPPVVAVAEDGRAVVPLLGGHHGANALAVRIADALGVRAAVTTAGELRFGVALDEPPEGWRVGNADAAKAIMAGLLAGDALTVVNDSGVDASWLAQLPTRPDGNYRVRITERAEFSAQELLLHPATVVIGAGCERLVPPEELIALAEESLESAGLSRLSVACVASIDLKTAEPAVHALAKELGVPARFFDAVTLERELPRLATPSDLVFRETGCHGVAEGAALAAAGPDGRLALPKRRSGRATCAVAIAPRIVSAEAVGRPRGRLDIVGLGPGSAEGRTAEAETALREAEDWVGYRLYLDLLAPAAGKRLHGFELGAEEARVAHALDLAAAGRRVALVSSGDAGIYAMASLVFELVERGGRPEWSRVEIRGLAGVSAMQAAAARIGAPLGHDFCAISLSDLLTPWTEIERRLEAAAEADFTVALYNPISGRRRHQLGRAKEILLAARPAGTPVVIGRNLGRPGESIQVVALVALEPASVDMLSVVLVGASSTRRLARPDGGEWVYTPRGYEAKRTREAR